MTRRMQGGLGRIVLVGLVAGALGGPLAACDMPLAAGDDDGGSSDFAQVCTDAAGDVEPDSDCVHAPVDYESVTVAPGQTRMWRYYPSSGLTIPGVGKKITTVAGTLRRPVTVSSGGGTRTAVVKAPALGSSGGTLTKSGAASTSSGGSSAPTKAGSGNGSSGDISRGGFGVKGGNVGRGSAGSGAGS